MGMMRSSGGHLTLRGRAMGYFKWLAADTISMTTLHWLLELEMERE